MEVSLLDGARTTVDDALGMALATVRYGTRYGSYTHWLAHSANSRSNALICPHAAAGPATDPFHDFHQRAATV